MVAQIGYAVENINELKTIDNTVRVTGYLRSVTSERSWFIFVSTATDSADNVNIIQPDVGSGRWFKVKSYTIASEIADLTEYIQDVVGGGSFLQSNHLTFSYNDAGNALTISFNNNTITDTHINSSANIAQSKILNLVSDLAGKASTNHTHASTQISDFAEAVDDRVVALFTSSDGTVTFTYNDNANTLDIKALAASTNINVKEDGISEGTVNTFNFVGSSVDVAVTGNEATVTINAPSSLSTENIVITSGNLATNAANTYSFTAFPIGTFTKLETDYPARVRIYTTSSYAAGDISRPVVTELSGEHGCLLECVTTGTNLILDLAPPAHYYSTVSGNLLYATITNNDTVNRIITTTLTTLKW